MVIRDWEERIKGNMNPYPQQTSYQINRGESVRSKSEKILADLFYQYQIPYCYEPQLNLSDGTSLYPDFALLNVKKRKTIYWEHFGLVSDGDYAVRALRKLMLYEKNGMMIGKNLLYSLESNEMPLDIKKLEKKVREYLM